MCRKDQAEFILKCKFEFWKIWARYTCEADVMTNGTDINRIKKEKLKKTISIDVEKKHFSKFK